MRSSRLALAIWSLGSASAACGPPRFPSSTAIAPPAADGARPVDGRIADAVEGADRASRTVAVDELPPIVPAAGVVLMRPDAMVLDAPREGAAASELAPYSSMQHLYALQVAHPARVVGRAGDYYAIATGDPPEGTCYPEHTSLFRGLTLTVFVHQDDLFPVLTRALEQRFGTGMVKLDAGVALGPPSRRGGDTHHREAGAAPLSLSLLVPDDAIGFIYDAGKRAPASSPSNPDALLSATCEDGGDCVLWLEGDAAARISGPNTVPARRIERRGERSLVSITGPCVEVRATVGERALRALPKSSVGHGYGTACGGFTRDDFVVHAEARAYWPDGRVAGAVGPERIWMHESLSDRVGARRCFKRHPILRTSCGSEGKYLRVCFDEADLARIGDG